MPTYTYRCPECSRRYDLRVPVDHKRPVCLWCEVEMRVVVQPVGVVFKGDGWTPKGNINDKEKK